MSNNQIVHTVCMQTKDAIQRKEGEFTMNLASDCSKLSAVKIALGSLEFPIVQWTIEEEWAYVYYSEGFRPDSNTSHMYLTEIVDDTTYEYEFRLPLHLNKITKLDKKNSSLRITCQEKHGLWTENGSSLISCLKWSDVQIICGPMGRVSLSALYNAQKLTYVSPTEFDIPMPEECRFDVPLKSCCGYVHVPTYPSIGILCEVLTYVIEHTDTKASYSVEYDATLNRAYIVVRKYPDVCGRLSARIIRTELSAYMGYCSQVHEKQFICTTNAANSSTVCLNHKLFFSASSETVLPFKMPSDVCSSPWSRVRIEPGWYAPSHRPFCTGQPLRFAQELESAFNRFYFPLPERVPQNHCTGHFLVFTDPGGTIHMCPVITGKYNINALCTHLAQYMTQMSSIPGIVFDVTYENERISFTCEINEDGIVVPAEFSLNFNHPAQFDPSRIGFSPIPMCGVSSYTSESKVVVNETAPKNIYRMTEISHQKRLRFYNTCIPSLTCILEEYNPSTSIAIVHTYVSQIPFSHGFEEGDVVQISRCSDAELLALNDSGEWEAQKFKPCKIAPLWGRSGIVINSQSAPPHVLFVRVTHVPELCNEMNTIVQIQACAEPTNFCFGTLSQSLPAHMVGFPKGAVQWGFDGTTLSSRNLFVPPFDAPYIHSLDHPDYILMFLSETNGSKHSRTLQHANGNNVTTPFAKLVLYPMMREERMLPRDVTVNSQGTTQFTLRFANPDGTPYHFHGAEFSFSFNFVIA